MTTAPQRSRAQRAQLITLVLTGVLAAALGGIVWLSATSIPYLAVSPATDPVFGPLNACLLSAVPERVGFAASLDGKSVAAWSTSRLVVCAGNPPAPKTFERTGVTLGAWDAAGALWISESTTDAALPRLARLEGDAFADKGTFSAAALVGTREGVVALEPAGQLIALSADGTVSATRPLPMQRAVHLVADATGDFVAVFGGGRFSVVHGKTLESTAAEAPCPVTWAWWRANSPLLLVECVDLTFEVNAIDSRSTLSEPRRRIRSTLLGASGLYVQACDVLPCSVAAPP